MEKRWQEDLEVIERSISLMLTNQLQEAEDLLAAATEAVSKRDFRFEKGDHDMRGRLGPFKRHLRALFMPHKAASPL